MSEIETLRLDEIHKGDAYEITTRNSVYTVERHADGRLHIAGHPVYCGIATPCYVHGSRVSGWGDPIIDAIVVGHHLWFATDIYEDVVTSVITSIAPVEEKEK